jgi:hypothetical protein
MALAPAPPPDPAAGEPPRPPDPDGEPPEPPSPLSAPVPHAVNENAAIPTNSAVTEDESLPVIIASCLRVASRILQVQATAAMIQRVPPASQ